MNTKHVKAENYRNQNFSRNEVRNRETYRNLDVRGLRDLARGDVHYKSYVLERYLESYDFNNISSEDIPALRLLLTRMFNMVTELCNSISLYELTEEELRHTK